MKIEKIEGLIAAPFTPFGSDGEINLKAVGPYAELLHRNGMAGAFVCGTSGEGHSMSLEERERVLEAWIKESPKGFKVIAHVGTNSLPDAKRLMAHAQAKGAHAAAFVAPSFFKPANAGALADYCIDIAKAAPELPLYYYNIPCMTGVNVAVIEFLEAIDGKAPNFAGVKYTYENLMDYSQCLEFKGGKYDMLFGRDEILLCALALGAKGAVGSTFNYAAPLYLKLIERYKAGDLEGAKKLQAKSHELIRNLFGQGVASMAAQKEALRLLSGIDCGEARLPFPKITKEGKAKIKKALELARIEEHRCR